MKQIDVDLSGIIKNPVNLETLIDGKTIFLYFSYNLAGKFINVKVLNSEEYVLAEDKKIVFGMNILKNINDVILEKRILTVLPDSGQARKEGVTINNFNKDVNLYLF